MLVFSYDIWYTFNNTLKPQMKHELLKKEDNMKKILSLAVAAIMLLSCSIGYVSSAFIWSKDGTPSDWAEAEVSQALAYGLVPEHINSDYTEAITRSDFCDLIVNMIVRAKGGTIADIVAGYADKADGISFPDTDSENVLAAAALGIVNGRASGTFDPDASITRQEAAKMLALAAKVMGADISADTVTFADSDSIYAWAVPFVSYVNSVGVMKGTSTTTPPNFSPVRTYSREQSILTVLRLFQMVLTANNTLDLVDYIPEITLSSDLHSEKINTTPNFDIPSDLTDMRPAFVLSPLLGDGGVLQAKMPVRLWGSYYDGETKVAVRVINTVTGDTDTYYTETKDSFFELYIKAYEYGGPYKIEYISEEGYVRTTTDVFFGEVVMCGGQSNMGWSIGQCYDGSTDKMLYQDVIDNSYNEAIRRLIVWPKSGDTPLDELSSSDASAWSFANPFNLKDYSATAYFYARELNARYGIHVGIVSVCMGGTAIYTWFPKADGERLGFGAGKQPSVWYNTMVNPVRRMTARGTIWYQGEGHYDGYAELLAELITCWRREFDNKDMLFSVVQLPRYQNEYSYFLCREEDKKVCELVDNVTYSVNIDNGLYAENKATGDTLNDDGIHPYEKEPVGTRLAHATMEAFFGAKGIWRGPVMSEVFVKDGKVTVKFDNVGYGLTLKGLAGFEVSADGKKFSAAKPELVGKDTIVLTCDDVTAPTAVRYGYSNYSPFQEKPVTSCAQSVCVYNTKDGGATVAYPAEQFLVENIGVK